jgi:GT2 family glycosyltransferase
MPEFKIIIPVHNPPDCLYDTLKALRNDGANDRHVVVIDDGLTNVVEKRIHEDFPDVKVLRGDGNLWWAGGMKLGMDYALANGAEVVVWLNHDCQPDVGTISSVVREAASEGTGAVSAWCRTRGYEDFRVNPGFVGFKPIPVSVLEKNEKIRVDGVNGNCVAINASAIRSVGLPDPRRHRHYGDGPYIWRLHKAGYRNYVLTTASASLSRDLERCIDEGHHSMVWRVSLRRKLSYYFFSPRSKFHWKYRFYDSLVFRGSLVGLFHYPLVQARLLYRVVRGHIIGRIGQSQRLMEEIVANYRDLLPEKGLRKALEKLSMSES